MNLDIKNYLSRRRHLKHLLSLPLASGVFTGCSQTGMTSRRRSRPQGSRRDAVIIIGAGAAGLGAAEELRRYGYSNISFLEARERVGGRVWTSREWADAPMDLGATWIHGIRKNPLSQMAKEARVATVPTDYGNQMVYSQSGRPFGEESLEALGDLMKILEKAMSKSPPPGVRTLEEFVAFAISGYEEIDKRQVNHLAHALYESDLGEDSANLSLYAHLAGKSFAGGDVWFPGGYSSVFSNRFKEFPVRTGYVVESLDWNNASVIIQTNRGVFRADRVILTLPLGVLKKGSVEFSPGLPESKLAAIDAIGMGCLDKVCLRFPNVFWRKELDGFQYQSTEPGQWSQWHNPHQHIKAPVLVAYNSGSFARGLEKKTDSAIVAGAMETLRKIYGPSIPDPESFQVTRWDADPFAFGSYSLLAPGGTSAHIEELGKPVGGRLFFAGEATSPDHQATVHGAYLSGQREARRVVMG